jgi:enoyl-CoA hydratase/carnithine racemase
VSRTDSEGTGAGADEAGYEQIRLSVDGAVATLTLMRPERMNAWTYQMSRELTHAIERCNDDPAIGAMILTGEGRGFCAGADIQDTFQAQLDDDGDKSGRRSGGASDWVALLRRSKPLIAAVNGAAVGVGATMILPCDVIMAARSARFGMAFVKMGVVPELASSHFLVQRMGFGRASEMCLSGRLYGAEEAHDLGLVDRLVEDHELLERAGELAAAIAANPAPQLKWVKELLTVNGAETDLNLVQRRELERLAEAYATPEHKEAVAAFLEKRKPDYVAAARAAAAKEA